MKKILLMVLEFFFFTSACFAQNYYATVEIHINNNTGLTYSMNTITKVYNPETCQKILSPMNQLKEKYPVRTECVTGPEWEKLFGDTFANKPTSSVYISYKGVSGYETRINTKISASSNALVPGQPVDYSLGETIVWANAMVEALKKGGVKNARIIYPVKK